jgi:8-oxo-dGTP pyrophosphatase MutT (NUDIX family)
MDRAAIPAATLILVHERVDGPPELLMVERSGSLAFAPGALVFPGGRVDAGDSVLAERIGIADGATRIAAIRETLEECGIAVGVEPLPSAEQSRALQQALLRGADFGSVLTTMGLKIDAGALTPFARWIPGNEVSRRFDTCFFIASLTQAPAPNVGSGECVAAGWWTASDILAAGLEGAAKLIYPTLKNLQRLARFTSVDAMIEDARRYPVKPVIPAVKEIAGEHFVTIPDGLGYTITSDRLAGVWRG